MTLTSLWFPMMRRYRGGCGPPCLGRWEAESQPGLACSFPDPPHLGCKSAHTAGWSHPQALSAFLWALLFCHIWENAGSRRKAYRRVGRCTRHLEPAKRTPQLQLPEDLPEPIHWPWRDATFPAADGKPTLLLVSTPLGAAWCGTRSLGCQPLVSRP